MELRSCSFSSGEFSWSSSSSASSTAEMEAAEALADLAHSAMRDSGESSKWRNKRKRIRKRVKSESPIDDSVSNSTTPILAVVSDHARTNPDQSEPVYTNGILSTLKHEADADLPKPSSTGPKSNPSFGGWRSRQNLTEAEKEAQRLRRVLANRESARQTIRRRQALCKELTQKAADLTWENENLKREKELALKEYEALETTNKNLKIAVKVIRTEAEKSQGHPKLTSAEVPVNPTTNRPYFLYNHHSFSPICWPSVIQSSNSVQQHQGSQNAIFIPSNYPMPTNGKLDSSQPQPENSINVNGPRSSLYMLSYPWFFPVPDNGNGINSQPSPGSRHINDETSASNVSIKSSSTVSALMDDNKLYSLPVKVKPEVPPLKKARVINDLNETPTGLSPDDDGECADPHTQEMIFAPAGINSVVPSLPAVKNESALSSGIFAKATRIVNGLPEKGRDLSNFPSKKSVDTASAAEARRRRKELTKLKNLYGRQCRTNC